ncbi:MAG: TetR family transcriptional regulator [Ponticaulis sp.]|nr:TetR family transcriptional regulator [Ponticaulis sp.]
MDTTVKPTTTVPTSIKPRREGPKRSEASRQAILAAARDELVDSGWRGFSPDRLSRRAKASKQTIYRWWPSVASIAVEAAISKIDDPISAPGKPLDVQLSELLQPIARFARAGDGAHLLRSALLAAADDPHAGEVFRHWFNSRYRKALKTVLAEASTRGHIKRDYDIDSASEILFGPTWHRLVVMRGPLPEVIPLRSAQSLLAALRP